MAYSKIELHLARLEKAVPDDRKEYIRDLEAEGWEISYNGCYRARRGNERYSVPKHQCEQCGEARYLHLFLGRGLSLMPWCKLCREADPADAKRANDRLRQAQRHQALSPEEKRDLGRQRKQRKREIRDEEKAVEGVALQLAMAALESIDLSSYTPIEQQVIQREL